MRCDVSMGGLTTQRAKNSGTRQLRRVMIAFGYVSVGYCGPVTKGELMDVSYWEKGRSYTVPLRLGRRSSLAEHNKQREFLKLRPLTRAEAYGARFYRCVSAGKEVEA